MPADDPPFAASGPREYNPAEPVSAARRSAESQILAIPGVTGLGEGRDALGNPAWIAYVVSRGIAAALPKAIGGKPVLAEVSGEIDAQPQ